VDQLGVGGGARSEGTRGKAASVRIWSGGGEGLVGSGRALFVPQNGCLAAI
jgi:hypothetical protein